MYLGWISALSGEFEALLLILYKKCIRLRPEKKSKSKNEIVVHLLALILNVHYCHLRGSAQQGKTKHKTWWGRGMEGGGGGREIFAVG